MKELNFDTGLVTYKLNDTAEVAFNPTDAAFVERLFRTFDALDKADEDRKKEAAQAAGARETFSLARKRDEEMRGMIDEALGVPVCDTLFGSMNVYALADGLPVWCNLMLALMDEIDTGFAREQKAANPRIQKYTAKYHK